MTDDSRFPLPVIDALQLGAHRLSLLTDQRLFERIGVRVAFSGRDGGVSGGPYANLNCAFGIGDDEARVARNIAIICESIGANPDRAVLVNQVHGTLIREAGRDGVLAGEGWLDDVIRGGVAPELAECDGVISSASGVPVMIRCADCLPLVIVSPTRRFAIVHAGWRGALAHIAREAALAMAKADGASISSYNAYIGPHIHAECYEVDEDIEARFVEAFGREVMLHPRNLSLSSAVKADLLAAGLDERRICDAGVCTSCRSDEFYSYRASGGECGRHVAVAYRAARPGDSKMKEIRDDNT